MIRLTRGAKRVKVDSERTRKTPGEYKKAHTTKDIYKNPPASPYLIQRMSTHTALYIPPNLIPHNPADAEMMYRISLIG